MLPSNLLIVRKWRDKIRPGYTKIDPENLRIADLLIQTYQEHIGKTKGELSEAATGLEDSGYDYRYIRGLSTLLDRKCKLQPRTTLNPIAARRRVFTITNKKGFPITNEARKAILLQAAKDLKLTIAELDDSLYVDLEHELIIKDFNHVDPESLLKQYNLSLTQTLLFYSTRLTFTTIANWQNLFRQIKWLGLIYNVKTSNGKYEVEVDGPASLFKLNRRYGTNLAKLLPTIIQNQKWHIHAKILHPKGERRLLNLELDSQKHADIMKATATIESEAYDSKVEEDFAERFQSLETGWKLTREPAPLPVGKRIMIPDFAFQKGNKKVFLEVMGFWTPEYVENKLRKFRQLTNVDMIIAANINLACQKLDRIGDKLNVVYYKRKISLHPILAHLKDREERLIIEQSRQVDIETLPIQESIVHIKEISDRLGIIEKALEEVLQGREVPGYIHIGSLLIKKTILKEIEDRLETRLRVGELNLVEASKIIGDSGDMRTTNILDALGYSIEWHGIDPYSTKIVKKDS